MLQSKNKKKLSKKADKINTVLHFELIHIQPKTITQRKVFDFYNSKKPFDHNNMLLIGTAGTGKTFLSVYFAMKDILEKKLYNKLIIIRSVVPTRDVGFLPGSLKQKIEAYETPYREIFAELFKRGDAYEYMKQKGLVEFMCTSFLRGMTLKDCVVLIDEIQNINPHEFHTVFTRMGSNVSVYLVGDVRQTDLNTRKETSCFTDVYNIINNMQIFEIIEFKPNDIVRGELVKQYIISREVLETRNIITKL